MSRETAVITVDGQDVSAAPGETLLAVCRRLGKDIPTLCHHEALEPYASCRVCLVELKGAGGSKLVPSCQYPSSDGLVIETDSPAVREARRMVLELLLARCPASDVVRDLAARFGVTQTPYAPGDAEETCILCGLCVRACEELVGQAAVGFAERGLDRRVGSPFDEPSEACIGCGACVNVCPTGKVEAEYDGALLRMRTWLTDLEMAECAVCRRLFAPKKLLERLAREVPELAEHINICPGCRTGEAVLRWTRAVKLMVAAGAENG